MGRCITVREYAHLSTAEVMPGSLDCAQVPKSAFDWLCGLSQRYRLTRETAEAQFVEVVDPRGDDASVRVVREASARAGEPWTFATESSPSPPVSTPKRPPRSTTAGRPRP